MHDKPPSILVAGGGQVAALAATALKRALPTATITLARTPIHPAAFADHAHTAFPSLLNLHKRIGITERSLLRRAQASHWLATRYTPAACQKRTFAVGHGAASANFSSGLTSAAGHGCLLGGSAAALACNGHFAEPSDDMTSPLSDIDYGLRFDALAHLDGLIALASHLNVVVHSTRTLVARRSDDGLIVSVDLEEANARADLFVDCTGPDRILSSNSLWTSWRAKIPFDRYTHVDDIRAGPASPLDELKGCNRGVAITSPGRTGTRRSYCWHADAAIPDLLSDVVAIEPGCADESWTSNVIAIGDSAAAFAPVGWVNLHLAVIGIERLLELIPADPASPVERSEFSRRMRLATDRAADFVEAHLALTGLATSYSPSLTRLLGDYNRRRRITPIEDDPISTDMWQQFLGGLFPDAPLPPNQQALRPAIREAAHRAGLARLQAAISLSSPYPEVLQKILEERQ